GVSLLVPRDDDVVVEDLSALAAGRASVSEEPRRPLAVGNGVVRLEGPFLRLFLVARPDLAAGDSLVAIERHGQLQAIPGVRLPRVGDRLVDTRDRLPGDEPELPGRPVQGQRVAVGDDAGAGHDAADLLAQDIGLDGVVAHAGRPDDRLGAGKQRVSARRQLHQDIAAIFLADGKLALRVDPAGRRTADGDFLEVLPV